MVICLCCIFLFFPAPLYASLHWLQENTYGGTWRSSSLSVTVLNIHPHVSHYFSLSDYTASLPVLESIFPTNLFSQVPWPFQRGSAVSWVGPLELAVTSCVQHRAAPHPPSAEATLEARSPRHLTGWTAARIWGVWKCKQPSARGAA